MTQLELSRLKTHLFISPPPNPNSFDVLDVPKSTGNLLFLSRLQDQNLRTNADIYKFVTITSLQVFVPAVLLPTDVTQKKKGYLVKLLSCCCVFHRIMVMAKRPTDLVLFFLGYSRIFIHLLHASGWVGRIWFCVIFMN